MGKNFKITGKKVTFLPGVETPVDHSDVAIGQQGIVGRRATGERAEDGRIAFDFVPEAKILEISNQNLQPVSHHFVTDLSRQINREAVKKMDRRSLSATI